MTGYYYPFGPKATVGRVDQGQDFGGLGSILAIGDARIVRTGAPGWPGERGVLYKLLDGPRRGQYIFVYEGIHVTVRPGQFVKAGQAIGTLIPGSSTGIEIGFANQAGEPLSHAEYTEGKETRYGKEMKGFLESLKGRTHPGFPNPLSPANQRFVEGLQEHENAPGGLDALFPSPTEALSTVGSEVASFLENLLGEKAVPILLNVGLIGGGSFLMYFGIARMVGVAHPVATPLSAARASGGAAAVAA